jgi:LPS sulfotransferase NodH
MTPAEQLFEDLQESRLFKSLSTVNRTTWVVTDDDTFPLLKKHLGNSSRLLTLGQFLERLDNSIPNGLSKWVPFRKRYTLPEHLVVASATQETALYQQVRQLTTNYDCKIYRLFNDLFINLSTNADKLLSYCEQPNLSVLAQMNNYAIVSIPRSGSTMLADILSQTGYCGHPKEHLRYSINSLLAFADSFDFQKWVSCMQVNTCTPNYVFGTKVISHFAQTLSSKLSDSDLNFLQQFKNSKLIYLVRKDKAEQAVSTYIARKSNLFFTPTLIHKNKRAEFIKTLDYDFDELYDGYQHVVAAEHGMALFVQSLGVSVLEISYENLIDNRTQTIEQILSFLNIETRDNFVIPKPATKVVSDRYCQPIREQFSIDLASIKKQGNSQ